MPDSYINIFTLCDGTWNGMPTETNILRLANIIQSKHENDPSIITNYYQGVGFDGFYYPIHILDYIIQGMFALDIKQKILQPYKDICKQATDAVLQGKIPRINLFGFSRGAYTVKVLADFITVCGLVRCVDGDPDFNANVDFAYDLYFRQRVSYYNTDIGTIFDLLNNRKNDCNLVIPESRDFINFLGLFEVVGSVGLCQYQDGFGAYYPQLLENEVSNRIKHTYHALGAHENIQSFQVTYLKQRKDISEGGELIQTWFPGFHSQIGGFAGSEPIADATLDWMIKNLNKSCQDYQFKFVSTPEYVVFTNDWFGYSMKTIPIFYRVITLAVGILYDLLVHVLYVRIMRFLANYRVSKWFLYTFFLRDRLIPIEFKDGYISGAQVTRNEMYIDPKKALYVLPNNKTWNDIPDCRTSNYISNTYNVYRSYYLKRGFSLNDAPPPFDDRNAYQNGDVIISSNSSNSYRQNNDNLATMYKSFGVLITNVFPDVGKLSFEGGSFTSLSKSFTSNQN